MVVAKLIDRRFHHVPGKFRVGELFFDVPLDHSKPNDSSRLRIFARSIRPSETSTEPVKEDQQRPWLVYLQGGPGFGCGAPQDVPWVPFVLGKGYQVLFLDQRGTGLSSTITAGTLARQGNAIRQAEYLKNFRADNVVRDCEAIRKRLMIDSPESEQKWSIIGQSFGGFCAVTYLSMFPEGLKEAFIFGGLPALVNGPDPVYARTYEKVEQRNRAYYAKYPEDIERVKCIMNHLKDNQAKLPSGILTPARFQQLGILFGMHGGLDTIHDTVLRAWNDLDLFGFLTHPTLTTIDSQGGFDSAIIYAILHEAIYCQGQASNWSADRLRSENPRFHINPENEAIFFTGEMIYEDMFTSYTELNNLKDVAKLLASSADWPALYDEKQLSQNQVPVYAATYMDDMYVHFDHSMATAAKIRNIKQFITNTMYHNALRAKSDEAMKQLFALKEDSID